MVWDPLLSMTERADIFKKLMQKGDFKKLQDTEKQDILYAVKVVSLPSHPAYGQFGLYAKKKISPSSWIIDYCGLVTKCPSETSDYVLKFTEELSIDAALTGNEARMINDYRGIGTKPNAEFVLYFDSNSQTFRMGVFALHHDIKKNEEILVTYGKGFWKNRGLL